MWESGLSAASEFTCSETNKVPTHLPQGRLPTPFAAAAAKQAGCHHQGPAGAQSPLPAQPPACACMVPRAGLDQTEPRAQQISHAEMEPEKCFCILLLGSHSKQSTAQLSPRAECQWWLFSNSFATIHHLPHAQQLWQSVLMCLLLRLEDMHQIPFRDSNTFRLRSSFNCSSK